MAKEMKPLTAEGYDHNVTLACEHTLLTLLSAFGSLKGTLRLIGGLVPRYLTPATPPGVPHHAGTSDVDIVLNLEVLATENEYTSLANQLKRRGFKRGGEEGSTESWRWRHKVGEHIEVVVELLRDAGSELPGKAVSVDGEKVSALTIQYAGIVHDWYQEKEINGQLEDGMAIETVRFADVPAFVILKAIALDQRNERKDAADLIHVIKHSGTIEEVAALFVQRIHSNQHPDAMEAGRNALRKLFCDDQHCEGHMKLGSGAYANFSGSDDDDELAGLRLYASSLVTALLEQIEIQLAEAH